MKAPVMICILSLFLLYIICRIFIKPVKWLLGFLLSCLSGILVMLVLNKLPIGISFPLNPLTSMISGVLGLPGMAVILILQNIL